MLGSEVKGCGLKNMAFENDYLSSLFLQSLELVTPLPDGCL